MENPPETDPLATATPTEIIRALVEELDRTESKVNQAALDACQILGRQLAAMQEIAETWSARAVHAEAELARMRTIELVDALRPGSDEFSD